MVLKWWRLSIRRWLSSPSWCCASWNLFRSNWTMYVLVWSLKFQNRAVLNMANVRTCDCVVNAHLMWNYSQMFHGFKKKTTKQWISLSDLYEIDFIANKKNLFTNVTHIVPDKCSHSQNRSISSDTVFSLTTGGNKSYGCTLKSLRKNRKLKRDVRHLCDGLTSSSA